MSNPSRHRVHPTILTRARNLRQSQTMAEARLWARLRNGLLNGYKFRRQHPIGPYVVDFYCAAAHLGVEIDGDSHGERTEYDATRTAWLREHGVWVIRFSNDDVHEHLDAVLDAILRACEERTR